MLCGVVWCVFFYGFGCFAVGVFGGGRWSQVCVVVVVVFRGWIKLVFGLCVRCEWVVLGFWVGMCWVNFCHVVVWCGGGLVW